jgi:hypothetical protein
MSFTVEDFHDLVRLVTEKPEWRADLRRLVLTEELLSLPEQLAKFQLHTEERFQALIERIAALEERTEKRFQELTERIAALEERTVSRFQELAERVTLLEERTETRFQAVEGQIATLTAQISTLAKTVEKLVIDVGELKGESLENRYRTRAPVYFSRLLRKIHVLSLEELASLLDEAVDAGALSEREAADILLADLVVRGKQRDDGHEVYLVVEISWGVGPQDVERAVQRSRLLAKAGLSTAPVVAGREITKEARQLAQQQQVRQITDGQIVALE